MHLSEVHVQAAPLERLERVLGETRAQQLRTAAASTRALLAGRTLWNVNSAASGGGVAEMLEPLIAYTRGVGIDARWLVIDADPEFFRITKRLHHHLHGARGDGGELGPAEETHYLDVLRENAAELLALVRPGDVVLLHDPQTAGMSLMLQGAQALLVWRCHVGTDRVNDAVQQGWHFLRPALERMAACVFSRATYVPEWLADRTTIIPPSIDPFAVKNQEMAPETVHAVLQHVGLLGGPPSPAGATFLRRDGSPGRVDLCADLVRAGPLPSLETPWVVQVSRWDPLKDMAGVMSGFVRALPALGCAQLALVGPNVTGVADDPEGAEVLNRCIALWRELPHAARGRVQLVCLPLTDPEENAAIVNAVQRHATVVVQKSLAEGFGLTVAEAMWKSRPVVASAVGGIQDQIVNGESGLLLHDPSDLDELGGLLARVLGDPAWAARLGAGARLRALEQLTTHRHLLQYTELFGRLAAVWPNRAAVKTTSATASGWA